MGVDPLLCSETSNWSVALSSFGRPVWPVTNYADAAVLAGVASMFGSSLRFVPSEAIGGSIGCIGDDVVVSLDQAVTRQAELYAHLTRRTHLCACVEELPDIDRVAVVVAPARELTSRLYEALFEISVCSGRAVGILSGSSEDALWSQVVVRSAASAFPSPPPLGDVDLFPTMPFDIMKGITRVIAGGRCSDDDLREILGTPASMMTLSSHADGVDLFLGAGRVLCPFADGLRLPTSVEQSPRCEVTGYCHRLEQPRDRALASGALFEPSAIRAQQLVINSCLAFLPADGVVSPEWGLGLAFADSPGIGAVIGSWETTFSAPSIVPNIVTLLHSDERVGVSVANLNRRAVSDARLPRLCLFGDPETRCARLGPPDALRAMTEDWDSESSQAIEKLDSPPTETGRLVGLQSILDTAAEFGKPSDSLEAARLTIRVLRQELNGVRTKLTEDERRRVNEATLNYAIERGRLSEGWTSLVGHVEFAEERKCGFCDTRVRPIRAHLGEPTLRPRLLVTCPRCGVVADIPEGTSISLRMSGPSKLTLVDPPHLPDDWIGALLVASSLSSDDISLPWPRSSHGQPSRQFVIPAPLPPGPLRLSVFLIWSAEFAVMSRMLRADRIDRIDE